MILPGDILFVRNYTFVGEKIRKIINCYYNHVCLFISENILVEVSFKGVKITPLNYFIERQNKGKCEIMIKRCKQPFMITKLVDYALQKVGHKYDYLQFLSLLIMFTFKISRKIELFDAKKAWTCSALISDAFYEAGLRFHNQIDPDNITPADLYFSPYLVEVKE